MRFVVAMVVFLFVYGTAASADDLQVRIEKVVDLRVVDGIFSGLDIDLIVSSPLLQGAKSYRFALIEAVDDLGDNLLKEERFEPDFDEIDSFDRLSDQEIKVQVDLENPARRAAYLKRLTAEIELYVPGRDPEATAIINDFTRNINTPFASPKLQKAGVAITVFPFEGEEVSMQVEDPQSKIMSIAFLRPNGTTIPTSGRFSMGTPESYRVTYQLNETPPKGAGVKVYLKTEKSLIKKRLSFSDIVLP